MQVPERSTLILQAQKELENEKASQKKKTELLGASIRHLSFGGLIILFA